MEGDGGDGPEVSDQDGEDSCFGIGHGVWFLKFGIIASFGGCMWWSKSGHRFSSFTSVKLKFPVFMSKKKCRP